LDTFLFPFQESISHFFNKTASYFETAEFSVCRPKRTFEGEVRLKFRSNNVDRFYHAQKNENETTFIAFKKQHGQFPQIGFQDSGFYRALRRSFRSFTVLPDLRMEFLKRKHEELQEKRKKHIEGLELKMFMAESRLKRAEILKEGAPVDKNYKEACEAEIKEVDEELNDIKEEEIVFIGDLENGKNYKDEVLGGWREKSLCENYSVLQNDGARIHSRLEGKEDLAHCYPHEWILSDDIIKYAILKKLDIKFFLPPDRDRYNFYLHKKNNRSNNLDFQFYNCDQPNVSIGSTLNDVSQHFFGRGYGEEFTCENFHRSLCLGQGARNITFYLEIAVPGLLVLPQPHECQNEEKEYMNNINKRYVFGFYELGLEQVINRDGTFELLITHRHFKEDDRAQDFLKKCAISKRKRNKNVPFFNQCYATFVKKGRVEEVNVKTLYDNEFNPDEYEMISFDHLEKRKYLQGLIGLFKGDIGKYRSFSLEDSCRQSSAEKINILFWFYEKENLKDGFIEKRLDEIRKVSASINEGKDELEGLCLQLEELKNVQSLIRKYIKTVVKQGKADDKFIDHLISKLNKLEFNDRQQGKDFLRMLIKGVLGGFYPEGIKKGKNEARKRFGKIKSFIERSLSSIEKIKKEDSSYESVFNEFDNLKNKTYGPFCLFGNTLVNNQDYKEIIKEEPFRFIKRELDKFKKQIEEIVDSVRVLRGESERKGEELDKMFGNMLNCKKPDETIKSSIQPSILTASTTPKTPIQFGPDGSIDYKGGKSVDVVHKGIKTIKESLNIRLKSEFNKKEPKRPKSNSKGRKRKRRGGGSSQKKKKRRRAK